MIITIDGPSGTGKSTVARAVADQIGFTYFDTGAMYRALTWLVLEKGVDPAGSAEVERLLADFQYRIRPKGLKKHYFVNGKEVTEAVRRRDVTQNVSTVAAIPAVRHRLVEIQKEYGERVNAVFEGRDLGTVVFPNAEIKIYLTADPEVRAERRYAELKEKSPEVTESLTLAELTQQIMTRDQKDMTRKVSPLKKASDAFLVDTSNLSVKEVVEAILTYKEKVEASLP